MSSAKVWAHHEEEREVKSPCSGTGVGMGGAAGLGDPRQCEPAKACS